MTNPERASRDAEIRASRERLERSLDELGAAVEQELGWATRVRGLGAWVAPLVAGAVGLAAALALRRKLPRLRERAGRARLP